MHGYLFLILCEGFFAVFFFFFFAVVLGTLIFTPLAPYGLPPLGILNLMG